MDSDTSEKRTEQRTLPGANNVTGSTTSRPTEKMRFSGFPNIKKLIYQGTGEYEDDASITRQWKHSINQEQEKSNYTDSELVFLNKNGKREKEIEDMHVSLTQPCSVQISSVKKCKLLKTSEGYILRENTDIENESDRMESKAPKEDSSDSDSSTCLPPTLKDLILKSKTNKITRPPNAFMLFAKEQRLQVGVDNPKMTNREISTILGNMWRDLNDGDKAKYYRHAQALEKLHKEMYPGYVYNPSEARLRKQFRIEKKQKQRRSPLIHKMPKCSSTATIAAKSAILQEMSPKVPAVSAKCNAKGLGNDNKQEVTEGNFNSCLNALNSPLSWPYASKWNPSEGNHPPFPGISPFCCHCHIHSLSARFPGNIYLQSANKRDANSSVKFGTHTPNLPLPRPMFPGDFHPAIWNPWYMFPNPYFMNIRPPSAEFYKNWMGLRQPLGPFENHFESQQNNSPQQTNSQTNMMKNVADDAEDDDDPHALVIDDQNGDELNKENNPDAKRRYSSEKIKRII